MVKWDTLVAGILTPGSSVKMGLKEFSFSCLCFLNFTDFQPWSCVIFFIAKKKKKITATITAKAASHIFMQVKQNNEFKVLSTECLVPSWHSDKGYLLSMVHLHKCCPQHVFLTWMFCFEVPCFSSLFSIVPTTVVQVINLAVFLAEFLRFLHSNTTHTFFSPASYRFFCLRREMYPLRLPSYDGI